MNLGQSCPYCAGKRAILGEADLATLRPELMEQWDYERNTIDPREITVGFHDKAWWQCSEGHVLQAIIYARAKEKGTGCPICAGTVKWHRSSAVEHSQQKRYAQPRKAAEKAAAGMHI